MLLTFALGATVGCGDPSSSAPAAGGTGGGPTSGPATTRPSAAMEAVDPNCHMAIQVTPLTPRAEVGGKTYYFCSDDCRDEFLRNHAHTAAPATRP